MEIDYEAVLADLEAKEVRVSEELEAMRQMITNLRTMLHKKPRVFRSNTKQDEGGYEGLTILAAVKKLLAEEGRPLSSPDIAVRLAHYGYKFNGVPTNTITAVLSKSLDKDEEIYRPERGMWALRQN